MNTLFYVDYGAPITKPTSQHRYKRDPGMRNDLYDEIYSKVSISYPNNYN